MLTVKSPAKLILSGEHAVVHGYPALAMAINRYLEVNISFITSPRFLFNLKTLNIELQTDLEKLHKLKNKLYYRYSQYREGNLDIQYVLSRPEELSFFTFINFIDHLIHPLQQGIQLIIDSTITMDSGMGSSAANIMGITYALARLLKLELTKNEYFQLGLTAENLQHGSSSGIDICTVLNGGLLYFEKGRMKPRPIPTITFQLVQTGARQSTTAECVLHTRPFFAEKNLGPDFAAVTQALDLALQNNQVTAIQACIRENHQLLNQVGVVPTKVNNFIHDIEKLGAAAKICGAGSVRGDNAGIVLVIGDYDIAPIAKRYHYSIMSSEIDTSGVRQI